MDEKKVREVIEILKLLTYIRKRTLAALPASARKESLYNNEIAALETGIKALEKQLPKKSIEINDAYTPKIGEFRVAKCPNCGHEVSDRFDICLECGQKLDWSE